MRAGRALGEWPERGKCMERKGGMEQFKNGEEASAAVLQCMGCCHKTPLLVAIDGRCAAGKTTLAGVLKEKLGEKNSCNIIHMDHFFLQPWQRTALRIREPGGNVDYERFREEVMLPLSQGRSFSYRIYDCGKEEFSESVAVEPGRVMIVEGSYSCHPVLWDFYDLRIWLDVNPEEQMRRIRRRNGEAGAARFRDRWIPLEEKYFAAFRIRERCDHAFFLQDTQQACPAGK